MEIGAFDLTANPPSARRRRCKEARKLFEDCVNPDLPLTAKILNTCLHIIRARNAREAADDFVNMLG